MKQDSKVEITYKESNQGGRGELTRKVLEEQEKNRKGKGKQKPQFLKVDKEGKNSCNKLNENREAERSRLSGCYAGDAEEGGGVGHGRDDIRRQRTTKRSRLSKR